LIFSGVIKFLLESYPANTYAFFFGLILASAGFVYRHVSDIDYRTGASALVGFLFAFVFIGLKTLQASHSFPVIFFSGVIAICAMILPGISGAFILFFLGQYEYMLTALHSLDMPVIAVFITGALVGLFGIVRVMGYLLRRHKSVTMAFLVGLMLGALRLPYQNIAASPHSLPLVLVSGAAGFFLVLILERVGSATESDI
jgi:putative membrane protein